MFVWKPLFRFVSISLKFIILVPLSPGEKEKLYINLNLITFITSFVYQFTHVSIKKVKTSSLVHLHTSRSGLTRDVLRRFLENSYVSSQKAELLV